MFLLLCKTPDLHLGLKNRLVCIKFESGGIINYYTRRLPSRNFNRIISFVSLSLLHVAVQDEKEVTYYDSLRLNHEFVTRLLITRGRSIIRINNVVNNSYVLTS